MKKYSDEYIGKRQQELSRFITYCLQSESIKQDFLFESFLDAQPSDYKKTYTKLMKTLDETTHLSAIVAFPG